MTGLPVLALDVSLTSTGWASAHGSGVLTPPKASSTGVDRLRWIRAAIMERAEGCALAVIEGYSYSSKGRAVISLGELGGVLRCAFADADIPHVTIPPTCRALFATGKGNAPKEAVLAAAIRALGYEGHSHDEADALWLRAMALAHYAPLVDATAAQGKALAGIDWPAVSWPTLFTLTETDMTMTPEPARLTIEGAAPTVRIAPAAPSCAATTLPALTAQGD